MDCGWQSLSILHTIYIIGCSEIYKVGGTEMNKIKSKVFCEKKGKYRIAFKTREKANFFIEHFDEFVENSNNELKPVRSFYCVSCGMWHITHFPSTAVTEQTAERDRKIEELEILVQRLKSEFRQKDWEAWKPIVEEGINLLDEFRKKTGFEKLVENIKTQLEHCSALIKITEAKMTGNADEDFKRIRKTIEQKTKALDYDGFEEEVSKLIKHFRNVYLRKALSTPNKELLNRLTVCEGEDETMNTIRNVMELAEKSIPDSRIVDAEELYTQVLYMTLYMDKLFIFGLPRTLWDILQKKVNKIVSVLDNSFGTVLSKDGIPLIEKVRIITNDKLLQEVSTCIIEDDKELAMEILQLVDTRMGQLPFSSQKMKLMQQICLLGEKVFE